MTGVGPGVVELRQFLDATGKMVRAFGEVGEVDLWIRAGRPRPRPRSRWAR